MIITLAKKIDLRFLYEIYNYNVSKNIFSAKKKITFSEHKTWFISEYLKKKFIYIYIAYVKKKKIGYVRFGKIKNNIYDISFSLKSKFYGSGLGHRMLKKCIEKFLRKKKAIIIARVKKKNLNSIKCLIKNNFVKMSNKNFFYDIFCLRNHLFFKYIKKKN
jgi:L-amino acid N-acyltransferase YncA